MIATDIGQVPGAGLHIVVQLLDVAHAHCARGRRRHLHQAGGTACASCGGVERRLLERQRGQIQPVQLDLLGVALQGRTDLFQALAANPIQRILHLVQPPVDPFEGCILIVGEVIVLQEPIGTGPEHAGLLAHEPVHAGLLAKTQVLLDAQLRHDLGPALGDGLLDDCRRVDPGLHHLQHILHRQRRVDPLGDNGASLRSISCLFSCASAGPAALPGGSARLRPESCSRRW